MDAADEVDRLRHDARLLRQLIDAAVEFGVPHSDPLLHAYATVLYERTRRLDELEQPDSA